ncbi:hypothetical protein THAOC_00524, partial [Thalassiosira oceanica]
MLSYDDCDWHGVAGLTATILANGWFALAVRLLRVGRAPPVQKGRQGAPSHPLLSLFEPTGVDLGFVYSARDSVARPRSVVMSGVSRKKRDRPGRAARR